MIQCQQCCLMFDDQIFSHVVLRQELFSLNTVIDAVRKVDDAVWNNWCHQCLQSQQFRTLKEELCCICGALWKNEIYYLSKIRKVLYHCTRVHLDVFEILRSHCSSLKHQCKVMWYNRHKWTWTINFRFSSIVHKISLNLIWSFCKCQF